MYLEINFALKRDPRQAPLNGTSCVEEGWYCTRKHNNPQYYKACHSNYVFRMLNFIVTNVLACLGLAPSLELFDKTCIHTSFLHFDRCCPIFRDVQTYLSKLSAQKRMVSLMLGSMFFASLRHLVIS